MNHNNHHNEHPPPTNLYDFRETVRVTRVVNETGGVSHKGAVNDMVHVLSEHVATNAPALVVLFSLVCQACPDHLVWW